MYRLLLLVPALLLAACGSDSHNHAASADDATTAPVHETADEPVTDEATAAVKWDEASLNGALESYLNIAELLAADTFDGVAEAAASLSDHIEDGKAAYEGESSRFERASQHAARLAAANDIEEAREAFGHLSPPFISLVRATGAVEDDGLYRMVCGMADAPGDGVWLQRGDDVRNPYFGSGMLRCARDVEAL